MSIDLAAAVGEAQRLDVFMTGERADGTDGAPVRFRFSQVDWATLDKESDTVNVALDERWDTVPARYSSLRLVA